MIKTRLVGLLSHAKKIYRVHDSMAVDCVTFPGGSSIFHCRITGTGVVSERNRKSVRTDNSYAARGSAHPVLM